MDNTEKIISLLNRSFSVFHVVSNMEGELIQAGYQALDEKESFALVKGGKYYVKRNGTSLIAFAIPENLTHLSFQLTATHNDSPTLKLKPDPLLRRQGLLSLNVEPYGGLIYSTWLDKPLSFAGRLMVKKDGKIESHLLAIDEDLLIIPNVAIHLNREINKGFSYDPAKDLIPLFGTDEENFDFKKYLLQKAGIEDGELLSFDLFLYNREKARRIGLNQEFLASGRLDDLSSAYAALLGFLSGKKTNHISLFASFDNEEVGSLTKQGANSTFLKDVMQRIVSALDGKNDDYQKAVANSILLSIDNAHATHPNHPEYADSTSFIGLNKGIVIKYNANQSYTSDALSASLVFALAKKAGVPLQEFTNRSDLRGGSTLGNLSNSEVSLTSVDIGIPQLAMHSSYEVLGIKDLESLIALTKDYFSTDIRFQKDDILLN